MKIEETIGIDVSKLTIDVTVHSNKAYCKFENTEKDFKRMIKWAFKESNFTKESILFVFEHTGLYSQALTHGKVNQSVPYKDIADNKNIKIAC